MKTKKYAEETEGYSLENKTELSIDYVTEAQSEEVRDVLRRVAEATLQSGMRFVKHTLDEDQGREQVIIDGEDCSAVVVANLVSDLKDEAPDLSFHTVRRSMEYIAIVFEDEKLEAETEEENNE